MTGQIASSTSSALSDSSNLRRFNLSNVQPQTQAKIITLLEAQRQKIKSQLAALQASYSEHSSKVEKAEEKEIEATEEMRRLEQEKIVAQQHAIALNCNLQRLLADQNANERLNRSLSVNNLDDDGLGLISSIGR